MASQEVPQGQELTQEEYVAQAQRRLAGFAEHIRALVEANKALVEGGVAQVPFTGEACFISFMSYGLMICDITTNDASLYHFFGRLWGTGLPPSCVQGGGAFGVMNPVDIPGDCSFEIHDAEPGLMQISWWRGSQILGTFVGASYPEIGFVTGGSGTWETVS